MKYIQSILLSALVSTACLASSQTPGENLDEVNSGIMDRTLKSVRTVSGLQMFEIFNGPYGLSTDGYGANNNVEGNISAMIPRGSKVEKAYLYAAGVGSSGSVYDVEFEGNAVDYNDSVVWSGEGYKTGRMEVTDIVKNSISNGACNAEGLCNFKIKELGYNDGEALVVIYKNLSLPSSTIAILDGHAKMSGDSTVVNVTEPIDKTKPGFFANMYLGISYSYSSGYSYSQTSNVKVNGTTLTTNAGSQDDGYASNGGLITVGSFDDPFSPLDPEGADDHEKYDLTSLLSNGDKSIKIDTYNSSRDDNVFLAIFHLSQKTDSVYIDGGPIISGPTEVSGNPGDTLTINYTVLNSASDTIDINTSLESDIQASFTDTTLLNASYDVNSSKSFSVNVTIPDNVMSDSYTVKINAFGNDISALMSTNINILQDNIFDEKTLYQGWNLLGTSSNINVYDLQGSLENAGWDLKLAYKFDNNSWKAYSPYEIIVDRFTIPQFDYISNQKGVWVYIDPITQ